MPNPKVMLSTNLGDIQIELFEKEAPVTVENFLSYVDSGFYSGTIFHRVIAGFMAQGGGFGEGMSKKQTQAAIRNEAHNGLKNKRGTLAMARLPEPDTASSQFFINYADNDFLDHKSKTPKEYGYCVFGKVVAGMDAVDAMTKVPTGTVGMHQNVPTKAIVINSATRV